MNNFILIYKVLLNKLTELDDSFIVFLSNCCKYLQNKYIYELDYGKIEVTFFEKKCKTLIEQLIFSVAKRGYNDILKNKIKGSISFNMNKVSCVELCKLVENFSGEATGILFLNSSDVVFSLTNSQKDVVYFKPESKRLVWYTKDVSIKNINKEDVILNVIVISITSEKIENNNKVFNEAEYLGEIYNTDKKLYNHQRDIIFDITTNFFCIEEEDRLIKVLEDSLTFSSDNYLYDMYSRYIDSEPTTIVEFKNEVKDHEMKDVEKKEWKECFDVGSQRNYYINSDTGERKWENPNIDESNIDNILSLPVTRLRFVEKNFFNDLVCDWIVTESERYAASSGGWLVDRHNSYPTTDIEVEKIPSVFSFVITSVFQEVKKRLEILYSINIDLFNVTDLFIAKYDVNGQRDLGVHCDGVSGKENFTFSVLLNDNFKGSAIRYEDGGVVNPKKGDMMVHTRNHPHRVEQLTYGVRYVMVGFINIGIKNN